MTTRRKCSPRSRLPDERPTQQRWSIEGALARFQAEWRPVGRSESAPDFKLRAHSDAKPVSTSAECARVLALACWLVAGAAGAGEDVVDGRRLFIRGVGGDGGEVVARFAGTKALLPPGVRRCAGCHGRDASGSREGGVDVAPITWAALTAARAPLQGRPGRPAYDDDTLRRALIEGTDSGGRRLTAMPRFALTAAQATALLHFLRIVGTERDPDPGVDENEIRLATVLPLSGAGAAWGEAIRGGLIAALERAGPIYGRRLRLVAVDSGDPAARARLVESDDAFAVVGALLPADAAAEDMPVIAPLVPSPSQPPANAFYVLAPLEDQMRVLVDALADETPHPLRLAIVGTDGSMSDAVAAQTERNGGTAIRIAGIDGLDATANVDAAIALTGVDLDRLSARSGARLIAASAAALALDHARDERLRLVLPVLPGDARGPPPLAQAAAAITIEGIKRMGSRPTRAGLLAALETLRDFPTGVLPPLGFSHARHLGTTAAVVVRPDHSRGMVVMRDWRTPR